MVASQWGGMIELVDGVFTVRVSGEIDRATAARFRQYLLGTVSMAHDELCVDLRPVTYVDSSGLHALVAAHEACEERAVRFNVQADGFARRILELAGLSFVLPDLPEPTG